MKASRLKHRRSAVFSAPISEVGCSVPPFLLCLLAYSLLSICAASVNAAEIDDPAKPSKEISLAALGYQGLSALSRFTTQHDLTINFLDDDHILFTYNPKKLIERHPECPPTHKDHIIQGEILELSSVKVVRETNWYVHDEHAYLWPLGQGRFLLRILNSLYELDGNLQKRLLLQLPQDILWTSVTPDGKQIIVETAVDGHAAEKKPVGKEKAKVKIEFLDAQSLAVQRTIRLSGVVPLEGTSLGFGDAQHAMATKLWLVRFGPNSRERANITRVRSRCIPNLLFPTNNTIFVGRCSGAGTDYNVSVFTVTGHFLWRQRWNQYRYEPAITRSEDASRIAVSSIAGTLLPGQNANNSSDEEQWPQVEQRISVFDSATGQSVLSAKIADAMVSAQNFGLAADGSRVAIVDGSVLRVFDLAPMSADERAKYVAMQADAPALAAPTARANEETAAPDDSEVFDVASEPTKESQLQPVGAGAPPSGANTATPAGASAQQPPAGITSPTTVLATTDLTGQNRAASAAQKEKASEPAVPTFRASAKTVVVDVVVTDSKGHPVKGLSQGDFQVAEDSKAQRVNYFHEYIRIWS